MPQGLAADVLFDGAQAADLATRIATDSPDRRAGTRGDLATAELVADAFAARGFSGGRGGQPQLQRFTHAGHELVNVIGLRAGRSRRAIVIVAARDAGSVPDAPGSAADTAALMQLARVYQGRPSQKTLVLASVDGSDLGEVGARELISDASAAGVRGRRARDLRPRRALEQRPAAPGMVERLAPRRASGCSGPWRTRSARRSARSAGGSGAFGQLARLSFPIGIGAQGVLLEKGYDAVRISGSGELPPDGDGPVEAIDEDRLGMLGTGHAADAQRGGPGPAPGARSRELCPGREPGASRLGDLAAGGRAAAPGARGLGGRLRTRAAAAGGRAALAAMGGRLGGAVSGGARARAVPRARGRHARAAPGARCARGSPPGWRRARRCWRGWSRAMVLALFLARWLAVRPDAELREPVEPGAGVALALAIAAGSLLLWLVNPFAGLLAVPAAHLWMLTVVTRPAPPRRLRAVLIGLGVAPAVLVAIYFLFALNLDPLHGAWYLLMLVTGHSVGIVLALIGCLMLAAACGTAEIAWRLPDEDEDEQGPQGPAVYGPGSYAGPGSLGGTQSALRR